MYKRVRLRPFELPEGEDIMNMSNFLQLLPRRTLRLANDTSALAGKGRGLGTETQVPRIWLRSLVPGLAIAAVHPSVIWDSRLRVFEATLTDPYRFRRRVFVLRRDVEQSRTGKEGYCVLVISLQMHRTPAGTSPRHQVSIVTYEVVAPRPSLAYIVVEGIQMQAREDSFHFLKPTLPVPRRQTPLTSVTALSSMSITTELGSEIILGENVHVLDVRSDIVIA